MLRFYVFSLLETTWKSLFSVVVVNALNKDLGLIQAELLRKMNNVIHTERLSHW